MNVLMFLVDGVEEVEAVTPADLLRRAGWKVTLAGLSDKPVTASNGTRLIPDTVLNAAAHKGWDLLIVPGGGLGVRNLRAAPAVLERLREAAATGTKIAAICAGPLVLQDAGVLDGHAATCHPAVVQQLKSTVRHVAQPVVASKRILTSQALGTAVAFALGIIQWINGEPTARKIADDICYSGPWPSLADPTP